MTSPNRQRQVVIVGAGISGLTIAWQLASSRWRDCCRVTVYEAANRVGGNIGTVHEQGFAVELGPNGFLDNKPATIALTRALGLGEQLVGADPAVANRFVFLGDHLRAFPTSLWAFLRSDLLTWRGKLRLLAEPLVRRRPDNNDDESLHGFVARRFGIEVADNLLDAFVTGIYAGDAKLLSAEACFASLVEAERRYGSVIGGLLRKKKPIANDIFVADDKVLTAPIGRSPRLWVTAGGMGRLVSQLADDLGDAVELGQPVQSITPLELWRARGLDLPAGVAADCHTGWIVVRGNQPPQFADVVVLTVPAFAQADIVGNFARPLADNLRAIPYTTAVVVAVGYRRDSLPTALAGFGYLTPQRLTRPVLGVLWSSSIYSSADFPQAPPDAYQFRAILGGWHRRDVLDWSEEKLVETVADDLRTTLGITAAPIYQRVQRWPHAIPQYQRGYRHIVAQIEAARHPWTGLYLAGNAFGGVAVNDCTTNSLRLAESIGQSFQPA